MSGLKSLWIGRNVVAKYGLRHCSSTPPKQSLREPNTITDYAIVSFFGLIIGSHLFFNGTNKHGLHVVTSSVVGELPFKFGGKFFGYRSKIKDQVRESKKEDIKNGVDFPWRILFD